jgi:hypothetical protein
VLDAFLLIDGFTLDFNAEKGHMQTRTTRKPHDLCLLLAGSAALFATACGGSDLTGVEAVESSAAALGSTALFEAESLTRTASAIGSKVTSESAASGGKYVEFNGTASPGAWIEFTLPNIAAGSYDLKFLFKSNTNRGIIQASVDGANQGAACNEYAASVAYQVACNLGSKTLTAGNHQIRFTVTGKSASSSGYQMVVDQIALTARATGPCDIYGAGGTPCVAAHSTVRALFGAYSGKLYQVRNAAGATKDINTKVAGGAADGAAQDAFCAGTTCVITVIYDQSGRGNDLWYQGAGSPVGGKDHPASATGESIQLSGNKVYSLYISPGNSYWVDGSQRGVPLGSAPEAMYMVTSGTHYNGAAAFDYGNGPLARSYVGMGVTDALNFSSNTMWGYGAGVGPWVMADFDSLYTQSTFNPPKNLNDPTQTAAFVTALLKNNGTTEFSLRGGNATSGSLGTYFKGALPNGVSPMKKQGAIVLGSGSDCCVANTNIDRGTFYEGCLVSGYPSDATEDAVQANIIAAGYGK